MQIIYEDKNLAVINKPANLSVHPAPGNKEKTLVDFLLEKYPEMTKYKWDDPSRAGIVHRLDKDTSGLIVVAKNPETQSFLQEQFKNRTVDKRYLALVLGKVNTFHLQGGKWGKIITDIGRDQKNRTKQKVTPMVFSWTKGKTRPAETWFKALKHFESYKLQVISYELSLLEVKPITGRMHQIRVHLKYAGYPVIGDPVYDTKESRIISKKLGLNRQFLHAYKLKMKLPDGSKKLFGLKLPNDLNQILDHISTNQKIS